MKYSNYVSQYTQKLQTLAYVEKMYKSKKKKKKDTKEYLQSSLKQISNIPFNKVPGQQSAFKKKSNFFRKLVKIMMLDWFVLETE